MLILSTYCSKLVVEITKQPDISYAAVGIIALQRRFGVAANSTPLLVGMPSYVAFCSCADKSPTTVMRLVFSATDEDPLLPAVFPRLATELASLAQATHSRTWVAALPDLVCTAGSLHPHFQSALEPRWAGWVLHLTPRVEVLADLLVCGSQDDPRVVPYELAVSLAALRAVFAHRARLGTFVEQGCGDFQGFCEQPCTGDALVLLALVACGRIWAWQLEGSLENVLAAEGRSMQDLKGLIGSLIAVAATALETVLGSCQSYSFDLVALAVSAAKHAAALELQQRAPPEVCSLITDRARVAAEQQLAELEGGAIAEGAAATAGEPEERGDTTAPDEGEQSEELFEIIVFNGLEAGLLSSDSSSPPQAVVLTADEAEPVGHCLSRSNEVASSGGSRTAAGTAATAASSCGTGGNSSSSNSSSQMQVAVVRALNGDVMAAAEAVGSLSGLPASSPEVAKPTTQLLASLSWIGSGARQAMNSVPTSLRGIVVPGQLQPASSPAIRAVVTPAALPSDSLPPFASRSVPTFLPSAAGAHFAVSVASLSAIRASQARGTEAAAAAAPASQLGGAGAAAAVPIGHVSSAAAVAAPSRFFDGAVAAAPASQPGSTAVAAPSCLSDGAVAAAPASQPGSMAAAAAVPTDPTRRAAAVAPARQLGSSATPDRQPSGAVAAPASPTASAAALVMPASKPEADIGNVAALASEEAADAALPAGKSSGTRAPGSQMQNASHSLLALLRGFSKLGLADGPRKAQQPKPCRNLLRLFRRRRAPAAAETVPVLLQPSSSPAAAPPASTPTAATSSGQENIPPAMEQRRGKRSAADMVAPVTVLASAAADGGSSRQVRSRFDVVEFAVGQASAPSRLAVGGSLLRSMPMQSWQATRSQRHQVSQATTPRRLLRNASQAAAAHVEAAPTPSRASRVRLFDTIQASYRLAYLLSSCTSPADILSRSSRWTLCLAAGYRGSPGQSGRLLWSLMPLTCG